MAELELPRTESIPKIKRALRFYQITAYITGVLLLLLVAEMILKYAFHLEVEAFGPFGIIALTQEGQVQALNLSLWVLIVHGWFYVVYLIASYYLWMLMRWPFLYLLALAGGGVVPFLSFITEALMTKFTRKQLALVEAKHEDESREDAELQALEAELSDEERAALDAEVSAAALERAREARAKSDATE